MELKYTEWQDAIGEWHCGNVSDLAKGTNQWWLPPRYLDMSILDYVKLLVEEYNAKVDLLTKHNIVLYVSWKNKADERRFKNWLNKKIKERKITI